MSSTLPSVSRQITSEDIASLTQNSARILNFSLKPFSNAKLGFLGIHERLTIEHGEPATVSRFFVKRRLDSSDPYLGLVHETELLFYGEVVPRILARYKGVAWAPTCHLARDELLVLEDLSARGFAAPCLGQLSEVQLESAVTCLARFHASSLLLEERLGRPLSEEWQFREKMMQDCDEQNKKWFLVGQEVGEAVARELGLESGRVALGYRLVMNGSSCDVKEGNTKVLSHADLWSNNMMFEQDAANCRFVDFQMLVYRPYAMDLAQLIHVNVSSKTRRRMRNDLLRLYHTTLREVLEAHDYGGPIVTLNQIELDVDTEKIFAAVLAVQQLPIILLSAEDHKEFTKDEDTTRKMMYESRKEFVMRVMQRDDRYRARIEEAVRELVEFVGSVR